MSFRGRGRGRGRGAPFIRDESGEVITARKLDGPPPLFPPLGTLPEKPDVNQKDKVYCVSKRRHLDSFWKRSPYHILLKDEEAANIEDELKSKRVPLSLYLKLTPTFFPAELLGPERKRARAAHAGMWTLESSTAKNDLGRLDKLAQLELKKGDKEGEEKQEGEEDDEEAAEGEDDDMEGDDYAQNRDFDDDDEYDNDFDDGGGDDEGPVY